jgi:hypothetical protein
VYLPSADLEATRITERAAVIPLMIANLNIGEEINLERWCLAWTVTNDRASIRMFGGGGTGIEINNALVAKAMWVTGACAVAVTRFV